MAKIEWSGSKSPSPGYERGSGYDRRADPTVRVVCAGRSDRAAGHRELVIATFRSRPFDLSKGERGQFFWDQDVAVGGAKMHPILRAREEKNKRLLTEEELATVQGEPVFEAWTEADPKRWVGKAGWSEMNGTTEQINLRCPNCKLSHDIRDDKLQEYLEKAVTAGLRELSLPALISHRTR